MARSFCDVNQAGSAFRLALLFVIVGSGTVFTLGFSAYYFHKWRNQMSESERNQFAPRCIGVLLWLLTSERVCTVLELCLVFYASEKAFFAIYLINCTLWFGSITSTMFTLLLFQLTRAFQSSIFEVSNQETRMLVTLGLSSALSIFAFWTAFGVIIGFSSFSAESELILMIIGIFGIASGICFLARTNFAFKSRLEKLVASMLINQNQDVINEIGNRPECPIDFAHVNHARLSVMGSNNEAILKAATKGFVTSLWMSLGLFQVQLGGLILLEGWCLEWISILGHLILTVAIVIIVLSVSLSLAHFDGEYQWMCLFFHSKLEKLVALETNRTVVRMHEKAQSESHVP